MIRTLLPVLTAVSILALSASAQAADLIIDAPVEAGIVDVGGNWDGVFLGGFAGYASGEYAADGFDTEDMDGWLLGAAIGTNFTLTDGIVAGVVGDLAWSTVERTDEYGSGAIDWAGSVRGRLGFDAGGFLPYLTAGLAVAGTSIDNEILDVSDSAVHAGWTVGAGVEFAVTDDVSIDMLYRYSDYGSQTYNVGTGDFDVALDTHQVTLGVNWKL